MSLEILKKYSIKAKKALWQNFLVNEDIIEKIADVVEVWSKNIVEVWPGYGALTEKLINKKPKSLNLVELDWDMIEILEKRIETWDFNLKDIDFNIEKIDVLQYNPIFSDYSVIANIPYYITSPILRHFLYNVEKKPQNMVILMQKDVWDKIIAWQKIWKKWKVRSSVLSLFIAKKAYVEEVIIVAKQNFVPSPKIESSVLLFDLHDKYLDIDDVHFLDIIKKWFWEPRKKLIKNFINSWYEKKHIEKIFEELSIDLLVRWEDLNIAKWCQLIWKINK